MRIALVGQPNCGKSTLFNNIAGYRSLPANFPGATVGYIVGKTMIDGTVVEVVDLPGTYSLSYYDDAEKEAVNGIFTLGIDVIVNIVDASSMIRSIELTLELISLNKPMVVALNMMDEAERKGITIDVGKLKDRLGVEVIPIVARKGKNIKRLLREALRARPPLERCVYSKETEGVIDALMDCMENKPHRGVEWPVKLLSVKAVEGFLPAVEMVRDVGCSGRLEEVRELIPEGALERERHALCMDIFEHCARVRSRSGVSLEDRIDSLVMHPILGYLIMIVVFLALFYVVFKGGAPFESIIGDFFIRVNDVLLSVMGNTLAFVIVKSAVDGIGAALTIALPYLVPFILIISFLEDVGYLPRIAYLMDSFLHKMGVHGMSIIPFIMGYGCNVPAVMATRMLNNKKEKLITAFIASLVPCSARSLVIMGLVGYFLGYYYVIFLYGLDVVVVVLAGVVLKRVIPGISHETMFDIPPYRIPTFRSLVLKVWYKIKDFVYIAVPMLVAGSIALALMGYFRVDAYINAVFSPLLEGVLGLPASVGVVLIFGVLRKELTLLMLYEALGVSSLAMIPSTMSHVQMLVFTVFVMFYVPCVATMAALVREIGVKYTITLIVSTFFVACFLAYGIKVVALV